MRKSSLNKPQNQTKTWRFISIRQFVHVDLRFVKLFISSISRQETIALTCLIIIKEIYKLDVFIPNLKEIEGLKVFFYSGPVLFVVFFIEIGLQVYVGIKKMIKKKLRNQVSPFSGQYTNQSTSQSTSQDKSYNYTLILVSRFVLQVVVFTVVIKTKDVLLRTILISILNILNRFGIHILPVLWILNHEPIKMYVSHKLYQIKVTFLD